MEPLPLFVRDTIRKELDLNHLFVVGSTGCPYSLKPGNKGRSAPSVPLRNAPYLWPFFPRLTFMSCMGLGLKNSFPQSCFEYISI